MLVWHVTILIKTNTLKMWKLTPAKIKSKKLSVAKSIMTALVSVLSLYF